MASYCFGVDVGGTTVKLGLFDMQGNVREKWEIPTRTEDNGKNILPDVATSILKKLEELDIPENEVAGIGIGTPGPVDDNGIVRKAVNLGWDVLDLNEQLSSLTGMKVKAGNDANVAALGEMWRGGAQGHDYVVLITLGTGVGCGIINQGKILTGSIGASGEVGHLHIEDDESEYCNCGNQGCVEQYASATGVVRLAKRMLAQTDAPSVLREKELTAKAVFDAVKSGDALALEVAERFGFYLGKALAAVAVVCNPEIFVIGGGVSKAGPVLLEYIRKYYLKYTFHADRNVEFALATLGNDAGIYGSAKLIIDSL